MHYHFSIPEPASGFIEITATAKSKGDVLELQLPAWRPGRYQSGHFARNVLRMDAHGAGGQLLHTEKVTRDRWRIQTGGSGTVKAVYRYYAAQLDGGGCYLSPDLLYVNPVQCCVYDAANPREPCSVRLDIPGHWQVATSMARQEDGAFRVLHFDELADSPFICSPSLKHHTYTSKGISFHIWLLCECEPGWDRMEKDFRAFTEAQVSTMREFPVEEFHFLVILPEYACFHGVEHLRSTMLLLGPGHKLMDELYDDFLGVASHELFHVWNVKTIRPAEMSPYDFTSEQYSRLGYVYEGFTTYYGDLFLARGGCFNLDKYLSCVARRLQRHLDNPGHLNYSVAESSFDTWLDGYEAGAPGRKTSIYDEGSLVALMLDLLIRQRSGGSGSLDDVMRMLYDEFGRQGKGYTEADMARLAGHAAGIAVDGFFSDVVYRAVSYESMLGELLGHAGLEIRRSPSRHWHERLGLRIVKDPLVRLAWTGSPAAKAGIMPGDELLKVNGMPFPDAVKNLKPEEGSPLSLRVRRLNIEKNLTLDPDFSVSFFDRVAIREAGHPTKAQLAFRESWLRG